VANDDPDWADFIASPLLIIITLLLASSSSYKILDRENPGTTLLAYI
jgi:hypothetical protein